MIDLIKNHPEIQEVIKDETCNLAIEGDFRLTF
jgi:hypothetical protein